LAIVAAGVQAPVETTPRQARPHGVEEGMSLEENPFIR
jgi:hypothetical protein